MVNEEIKTEIRHCQHKNTIIILNSLVHFIVLLKGNILTRSNSFEGSSAVMFSFLVT